MNFRIFVEQQQEVELHHITTLPAAQLIQKEGFQPKSFKGHFEKAAQMTGADTQDTNLVNAIMKAYEFDHNIFNKVRNVYFFTNGLKHGFMSDYFANPEWSPVS